MNIYKFFKSQDVANYCKKTRKDFTALEKAVLVSRSSQPIATKHQAYEEIVEHDKDVSISKTSNSNPHSKANETIPSLKIFLQDIARYEQELISEFMSEDDDSYYSYEITHEDSSQFFWENCEFSSRSFQTVLREIKEMFLDDEDEISYFRITKYTLNSYSYISATYAANLDLIEIAENDNSDSENIAAHLNTLKNHYINIPTPFKKGDILVSQRHNVFVLDQLLEEYNLYEYNMKETLLKHSYSHHPPFELCYYTEELAGYEQFLGTVSSYLKEAMPIEDIMSSYWRIYALQNIKAENAPSFAEHGFMKII